MVSQPDASIGGGGTPRWDSCSMGCMVAVGVLGCLQANLGIIASRGSLNSRRHAFFCLGGPPSLFFLINNQMITAPYYYTSTTDL
jgi:hypothetical protein